MNHSFNISEEDKKYFGLERISNSTLSWVKRKVNHLPDLPMNADYLEFGTLADNYIINGLGLPGDISDEWSEQLERMKVKFFEDKLLNSFVSNKNFKPQDVFLHDLMDLPFKVKMDGSRKDIGMGLEYKSMLCKSLHEFLGIIDRFDYDRQVFVYMGVSKIKTMILAGQSKQKSAEVFPVIVNEGHEIWERGRAKTEELVGYYKLYFS